MQKKILVEAISTAKAIQDGESRTRVLEGLTPSFKGWAENEPEYFYKVWCHLLTDLALYPRPACLQDLSHLMPALVELIPADERQKTLTEIIQAMKMVNTWWP